MCVWVRRFISLCKVKDSGCMRRERGRYGTPASVLILCSPVFRYYIPIPRKTRDGYRVVVQGFRNPDVSLFNHLAMCKIQTLIMDTVVHHDPTCPGWIFVCDMHGVSMAHMWKQSFFLGKKLMSYSQVTHEQHSKIYPLFYVL